MSTRTTRRIRLCSVTVVALLFFAAASLAARGDLDRSFGGDGVVRTGFEGGTAGPRAIAVTRSDRIVVAGPLYNESDVDLSFIVRYRAGGALDRTFSRDGRQTTAVFGVPLEVNDVALDRRGRIVLAGVATTGSREYAVAVARLKSGGSPDTSFLGDGIATARMPVFPQARAMAIDRRGRIVVAGLSERPKGTGQITVTRFLPGGRLDPDFSGDGKRYLPLGAGYFSTGGVVTDRLNRIVLGGGNIALGAGIRGMVVVRLGPGGGFDRTFAGNGISRRPTGIRGASDLALGRRGKIVLLGARDYPKGPVVVRLRPNGHPDRSFSGDGVLEIKPGRWSARALTLDRRGGIIIGGQYVNEFFRGPSEIVRATRRGRMDDGFVVSIKRTSAILDLATDRQGRLVAAASTADDEPRFTVARILSE